MFGAGGHGQVVADAARCAGWTVLGFLDDQRPQGDDTLLGPVLGGRGWCRGHREVAIALGIGSNAVRQQIAEELLLMGVSLATVVHPSAVVSRAAQLGPGVAVLALAVVNAGARVERGAIVNSAAVVEHDVVVGSFAHVSPNATLAGAARLGDLSQLGAGACALPGVSIGPRCIVGAGAVVTRDVPANSVCMGVPARITRQTER